LREAYIASEGRGRNLAALASSSLTAIFSIFKGILYLRGKEFSSQRVDVIHAIAEEVGLATEPFVRLLEVKEGKAKLSRKKMKEVMEGYIEEVRRLASWLDTM
jgi:hypothetical protein